MSDPALAVTDSTLRSYAEQSGVCVRPLMRRLIDRETGDCTVIPLPCGSTREAICPTCALKARRLRMQQCAEGWHRDTEPEPRDTPENQHEDEGEDQGDDEGDEQGGGERRCRSTRRRDDVSDLPRRPIEDRTLGRTWTGTNGQVYRPSMFVTLTLPSYGKVGPNGAPRDPKRYDYRRAALDAIHLPKAWDRWVQNLRRGAGYKVQYFAAIETQRRLAGHLHLAIRGAIPREVLRAVTAGSYASVWWPPHEEADACFTGPDHLPLWDGNNYCDPETGIALPTWDQALDAVDAEQSARASHVVRFGSQIDIKGLHGDSPDVDRSVRYLTKYLTKSLAHTYASTDETTGAPVLDPALQAHTDRLHAVLRFLPCSPKCANWLRYGLQPQNPGPGLTPGWCPAGAHQRETAGLGGRRVLVSRDWTGKTLADHRADRAAVIREVLQAAGMTTPESLNTGRCAADVLCDDGTPRYTWEAIDRDRDTGIDYRSAIILSAREAHNRRQQYHTAKHSIGLDPTTRVHDPRPPPTTCGKPFSNNTRGQVT